MQKGLLSLVPCMSTLTQTHKHACVHTNKHTHLCPKGYFQRVDVVDVTKTQTQRDRQTDRHTHTHHCPKVYLQRVDVTQTQTDSESHTHIHTTVFIGNLDV